MTTSNGGVVMIGDRQRYRQCVCHGGRQKSVCWVGTYLDSHSKVRYLDKDYTLPLRPAPGHPELYPPHNREGSSVCAGCAAWLLSTAPDIDHRCLRIIEGDRAVLSSRPDGNYWAGTASAPAAASEVDACEGMYGDAEDADMDGYDAAGAAGSSGNGDQTQLPERDDFERPLVYAMALDGDVLSPILQEDIGVPTPASAAGEAALSCKAAASGEVGVGPVLTTALEQLVPGDDGQATQEAIGACPAAQQEVKAEPADTVLAELQQGTHCTALTTAAPAIGPGIVLRRNPPAAAAAALLLLAGSNTVDHAQQQSHPRTLDLSSAGPALPMPQLASSLQPQQLRGVILKRKHSDGEAAGTAGAATAVKRAAPSKPASIQLPSGVVLQTPRELHRLSPIDAAEAMALKREDDNAPTRRSVRAGAAPRERAAEAVSPPELPTEHRPKTSTYRRDRSGGAAAAKAAAATVAQLHNGISGQRGLPGAQGLRVRGGAGQAQLAKAAAVAAAKHLQGSGMASGQLPPPPEMYRAGPDGAPPHPQRASPAAQAAAAAAARVGAQLMSIMSGVMSSKALQNNARLALVMQLNRAIGAAMRLGGESATCNGVSAEDVVSHVTAAMESLLRLASSASEAPEGVRLVGELSSVLEDVMQISYS